MTGLILDTILMLLLVAALGYGIRLEKKLAALRAGQLAFAGAVTELNAAAGRAENALASLRASGEEADMLHDRIIKARALKAELEGLMARGGLSPLHGEGRSRREPDRAVEDAPPADLPTRAAVSRQPSLPTGGRESASAATRALAANHAAQQSLNRARRSLDEDLFAA